MGGRKGRDLLPYPVRGGEGFNGHRNRAAEDDPKGESEVARNRVWPGCSISCSGDASSSHRFLLVVTPPAPHGSHLRPQVGLVAQHPLVENEMAVDEPLHCGQPDGTEDQFHVTIVWQEGGGEPEKPTAVGDDGKALEEQRGNSSPVVVTGDDVRNFCIGGVRVDDLLADADQLFHRSRRAA